MKNTYCRFGMALAIAGCLGRPVAAAESDSTLNLTLDEAIEIALSDNPTVQVADWEITKQEYAKKGSLAELFPTIDFSATYNRTIQKQVMYMGGDDMPGMGEGEMSEGIKVGRNNVWSAGFSATLPIISAQLWKQLAISADEVELAVEKSRSSKLSMVSQVRQAFYGVLLAKDSYVTFKENYDNAMSNYVDIKQKYEQGLSSEYDLIRADVSVKNAEPNMFDAENAIVLAEWQLKALIGVDLALDIDCAGSLGDYEGDLYADYLSVDTTMVAGNSSLRQLDLQHRQLVETRKQAQAAYYPTLDLTFSYQWNAMAEDFKFKDYRWNPYSMLGLTLNIPIFSGGKRYNTLKQTKVQIEQLSLTRYDTERSLMVSVRQYVDKMRTCIMQYQSAAKGIEQARKGYEIAEKRYATGAGTLLEINDSQLALTQAQMNRSQSIYDFLVAKAMLDETMGTDYQVKN